MATAATDRDARREIGPAAVVVAVDARTPTERELVAAWAARERPGAAVLEASPGALDGLGAKAPDDLVHPVRVTWLPPDRDGDRSARLRDVALMANPRRPPAVLQARLARRSPDRVRVTAGEPATVADLRARFARDSGEGTASGPDLPDGFGAFVARQATLACDRAEREVIGDRYKVPRLVAEQIAASARFRERASALAVELGRPEEAVLADAEECLRELATVQSPLGIDLYRRFWKPMHERAWTVEPDAEAFERLRELGREHALVFLPTHRSYVDALVLQEALHEHDLPPNHILGGNNMAWWPLGPIGRRAGVVWIRRNFGRDRIYKLAVREFLGHLVSKRFNLEWYIEGGRTRTGKLRPPKLGLLSYLTEALEDDRSEDVMLVPVSIVYDRLREVAGMAAEQTGAVKSAEGLRWWADYLRTQSEHVGKARVHVGEPFLLRKALAEAGTGRARLEKVAFRICDEINRATPLTASALAAFALLGVRDRALSAPEVARVTAPVLDYARRRGLPGPLDELAGPSGLLPGLDSLTAAGVVERYDAGDEPVWSVASGGHHVVAFYRNGAIPHLVNRAIVEIAVLRVARQAEAGSPPADPLDAAWQEALALRDLLKFEFFFADKETFREELKGEIELFEERWRERLAQGAGAREILDSAGTLLAHRTLRSFLDAQVVVAERLVALDGREAPERDALITECLDIGGQWLRQRRLHAAEAVGRELFASALDLAANRGLLGPSTQDGRTAWRDEVVHVLDDLEIIRVADEVQLGEVLDDHRR